MRSFKSSKSRSPGYVLVDHRIARVASELTVVAPWAREDLLDVGMAALLLAHLVRFEDRGSQRNFISIMEGCFLRD